MKKTKVELLVILLSFTSILVAQDSTKTIRFKFFYNLETEQGFDFYSSNDVNTSSGVINIVNGRQFAEVGTYPSVAIEINSIKNQNFHEFELKRLGVRSRETSLTSTNDTVVTILGGGTEQNINLSLNYEYNFNVFKESKKIKFYAGIGLNPYFFRLNQIPNFSTDFSRVTSRLGANLGFVPRLKFRNSKKLGLEIKWQIPLVSLQNTTSKLNDPTIEVAKRTNSSFDFSALGSTNPAYSRFCFGISYKI